MNTKYKLIQTNIFITLNLIWHRKFSLRLHFVSKFIYYEFASKACLIANLNLRLVLKYLRALIKILINFKYTEILMRHDWKIKKCILVIKYLSVLNIYRCNRINVKSFLLWFLYFIVRIYNRRYFFYLLEHVINIED